MSNQAAEGHRAGAVLLYDGECGFCNASVQLVLRHDRRRTLSFAPLAGRTATAIRGRHVDLTGVDSMVWVDNPGTSGTERVYVRSAAALRVARYLGGPWSLLLAGWLVPRLVRDAVYDLIARHRHRLVRQEACDWVPSSERARFLE